MITIENLPRLHGETLEAVKEWLSRLRPHATGVYLPGWHGDDGLEQVDGIDAVALEEIAATVRKVFDYAEHWADPGVAYRLIADQVVPAESVWPGFVADIETDAARIGYPSIAGREKPNFVIEEYNGEFYLLEFDRVGKMSECPGFVMSRLDGVSFNPENDADYVNLSNARVIEGTEKTFSEIDLAGRILDEIHTDMMPVGPRH